MRRELRSPSAYHLSSHCIAILALTSEETVVFLPSRNTVCTKEDLVYQSSYIEKILRLPDVDKVNGAVAIDMGKKDLRDLIESVDNMMEKQQRTPLEYFPS
jgi:hypothetical protein